MSRGLRESILRWYLNHRRDLPWRKTRDPYAIWVSEVMLQQTRVETVVSYYEPFLRRFPNVRALARASGPGVLASWSGLGYYGRARNLHAAAQSVVREHAGRLPDDVASLRALPGIGEYTAGAIASVAFGRAAAAVDGNVIRVLARIDGLRGKRDSAKLWRAVRVRAEALAHGPRPGDWTQALMELGATVCLPRDPLCEGCPASRHCIARRSGQPDRFPTAATAAKPRAGRRLLLVARAGSRVLLIPDAADFSATWTVPYALLRRERPSGVARALTMQHLATQTAPEGPRATFRHRTFSHDWTYEVWTVEAHDATRAGSAVWVTSKGLRRLPVRGHTLKALSGLHEWK